MFANTSVNIVGTCSITFTLMSIMFRKLRLFIIILLAVEYQWPLCSYNLLLVGVVITLSQHLLNTSISQLVCIFVGLDMLCPKDGGKFKIEWLLFDTNCFQTTITLVWGFLWFINQHMLIFLCLEVYVLLFWKNRQLKNWNIVFQSIIVRVYELFKYFRCWSYNQVAV